MPAIAPGAMYCTNFDKIIDKVSLATVGSILDVQASTPRVRVALCNSLSAGSGNPFGDNCPFGFVSSHAATLVGASTLFWPTAKRYRTLDVSPLTRGVYVLKVEDREGLLQTFRIIR